MGVKALLERHVDCQGYCEVWGERDDILAIEQEATEAERARIRAAAEARKARITGWDAALDWVLALLDPRSDKETT